MSLEERVDEVVRRLAGHGRRTWARWLDPLFDRIGQQSLRWLSFSLADGDEAVLEAYGLLLAQGVGEGVLTGDAIDGPRTLLGHCLLELLPARLADIPPAERLDVLARTWNLCLGLRTQPAWVDRYVVSRASEISDPRRLDRFLVEVLEPVLGERRPSTWRRPRLDAVLSTTDEDEDFLPGPMHLAAPAVVCVHDRLRDGVQLGLYLEAGVNRLLGLGPCLGHGSPGLVPEVAVLADRVVVDGRAAPLDPVLGPVEEHVVAECGFVVASAVDSQRLWIVEAAS